MDFSFSKQGLLDALEARRAWAVALDKKQSELHKAAEKAALKQFRTVCRDAVKWDYNEVKKRTMYTRAGRDWFEPPSCPTSFVTVLDSAIQQVKTDGRVRYKISGTRNSGFYRIHHLLTHDENAKPDVCK